MSIGAFSRLCTRGNHAAQLRNCSKPETRTCELLGAEHIPLALVLAAAAVMDQYMPTFRCRPGLKECVGNYVGRWPFSGKGPAGCLLASTLVRQASVLRARSFRRQIFGPASWCGVYCWRSVFIGSRRAARYAGTPLAAVLTRKSRTAVVTKVSGSVGLM